MFLAHFWVGQNLVLHLCFYTWHNFFDTYKLFSFDLDILWYKVLWVEYYEMIMLRDDTHGYEMIFKMSLRVETEIHDSAHFYE